MPRFHVHRSIQIAATPQRVFEVVSDFRTWATWSPWLCAEPTAEVTVSSEPASVGSVYAWRGEIVGQGEIEHRRLEPGRLIEDEIRFTKPFRSRSAVSFEMAPAGEGTTLTWHMRGSLPWFMFWMCSQMEVFIGMDYERGLKMIKDWIETGNIESETRVRGVEQVAGFRMAGIRKSCAMRDIGPCMDAAFAEARQKFLVHKLPADGDKISVYHACDMKAQTFDFTSGFVIPDSAGKMPGELSSWSLPVGRALCVEHVGTYRHLGNAWSAAHQFVRAKKLKQRRGGEFEFYKNDSHTTPSAALRTEIYIPLK